MDRLIGKLWRADQALREVADRLNERRFDHRHGVTTAGRRRHADPEASGYQSVPERRLAEILSALPVDPATTTFVDLGCGRGRALLVAAERGFRRCVGVELDPGLAHQARDNARRFAGPRAGIQVVDRDVVEFEWPAEPSAAFLFNPFGPETMRRVVANVERSLRESPRPFVVAYLNPRHPEPWDDCAVLERLTLPQALARPPALRLFRGLRGHRHGHDLPTVAYTASPA